MALPNLSGLELEPAARACAPTGPFVALTDEDEAEIDPFSTEPLPTNKGRGVDGATFAVKTPNRADGSRPEKEYNFYDAKSLARLVQMQMRERQVPKDPLTRQRLPESDVRDLLADYPAPPSDDAADRVEPLDDDSDDSDAEGAEDADGQRTPRWAEEWLLENRRPGREHHVVRPFQDEVNFTWRTEYERGAVSSTVHAAGLPWAATQSASLFKVLMRVDAQHSPAFAQYMFPMRVRNGTLEPDRISDDAVVARLHSAFLPEGYPADAYALLNQAYRSNAGWEPPPDAAFGYEPEVGRQLIAFTYRNMAWPRSAWAFTVAIAPQLVRMLVLRSVAVRAGLDDPLLALLDRIRALRAQPGANAYGRLGIVPEMATLPSLPEVIADVVGDPDPDYDPSARLFWQGYAADNGMPDPNTWRRSLAVLIEGQARLLQWAERFGGPLGSADPSEFLLASEPDTTNLDEEWAESAAERLACARRHQSGLRTHERSRALPPARTYEFTYFAEVPMVYWRAREDPPPFASTLSQPRRPRLLPPGRGRGR